MFLIIGKFIKKCYNFYFDYDIINEISKVRNDITHNNANLELQRIHIFNYNVSPMPSLKKDKYW